MAKEIKKINYDVPLNSKCNNANIKFDYDKAVELMNDKTHDWDEWIIGNLKAHSRFVNNSDSFFATTLLDQDILFTLKIQKDNTGEINVLDEVFGQHYEFQYGEDNNEIQNNVLNRVYSIMRYLTRKGVVSGWNEGDYI